jgi:hypothetical protein
MIDSQVEIIYSDIFRCRLRQSLIYSPSKILDPVEEFEPDIITRVEKSSRKSEFEFYLSNPVVGRRVL